MKNPKIGSKYISNFGNGRTYYFTIIDISVHRVPSMKYGVSIQNGLGNVFPGMMFIGDKDLDSMAKMED